MDTVATPQPPAEVLLAGAGRVTVAAPWNGQTCRGSISV